MRENRVMKKLALLLLLISFKSMATTETKLTLYFTPSPHGMDWSSPASLAWTALKNRLSMQSRFMGHVYVEVQCGEKRELTGMVGKNFDYLNQLLVNGRGLGILYHSFDGRLEEKEDLDKELAELSKSGRMNFAQFNLNQDQCTRLLTYLQEYRSKDSNKFYGLSNRPRYAEGGGCSAFGASFVDVAGIMDEDIKKGWSNTVNIPLEFAGPPLKESKVSLFKILFGSPVWAKENEPHQKLFFWDPDLMANWVREKVAKAKPEEILKKENSVGILVDKSQLALPQDEIWRK